MVIGAHPVWSTLPSSGQLSLCNLVSLYGNSHLVTSVPLIFLGSMINELCAYLRENTVLQVQLDCQACTHSHLFQLIAWLNRPLLIFKKVIAQGRIDCRAIRYNVLPTNRKVWWNNGTPTPRQKA